MQKWTVANVYRYITNVYRYTRSGIGQKGLLIQKLGASSFSKCFLTLHKLSPSRLLPVTSIPKISCSARVSSVQFRIVCLQSVYESGKPYNSLLALLIFSWLYMDLFDWIWLVLFCDWWLEVSVVSIGRRILSDVHRASLMLFETGFWDLMIYIWAIWAVIAIIAISMARSKNIGKGKASSSSMEQAMKKRKSDASQPVKKGKGKRIASSSESEELSDSDNDEEIEAMFAEDSESDQEKWARSIANRGFHYERGVKLETFLYSHPIRGIIQEQNMHFVHTEVRGYLPSVVREFYTNLKENQRVETVLETSVMGR